jgi:arginase
MPEALRRNGVIQALGVRDLGDVEAGPVRGDRDPVTGVRGGDEVVDVTRRLRRALAPLLRAGERPLVVGGCCAVLLGIGAAVRDAAGRAGLAFIDGHEDFYDGATSPTGAVADMELGIVTGFGPPELTAVGGAPPLFEPVDVVALAVNDSAEARANGSPDPRVLAPQLRIVEIGELRAAGAAATGRRAAALLAARTGRYWVHLDLDALDSDVMPGLGAPLQGGLGLEEAADVLLPLVRAPECLGADVTILEPSRDPGDIGARRTVELLARVAGPARD